MVEGFLLELMKHLTWWHSTARRRMKGASATYRILHDPSTTLKNGIDWIAEQGFEGGQGRHSGFIVSSFGPLCQNALSCYVHPASYFRCTTCLPDF